MAATAAQDVMDPRQSDRRHLDTTLLAVLERRQADTPAQVFFRCEGQSLTYEQLWQEAGALAAGLQDAGVAAGDTVAALAYNSTQMLSLMFACLRLGAVWAPLNVALGPADLAYSVEATRARLLVVSHEMARQHPSQLEAIARELPVWLLDRERQPAPAWARHLDWHAAADRHPCHAWAPDEFCWVIFSGATTGRPKAIALPHAYGVASALRAVDAVRMEPGDSCFSILQMCHGWLLFYVIAPCLVAGIPCTATRWFSASGWIGEVKRCRATIVDAFLPMINAILAQPAQADDADNCARALFGGMGSAAEHSLPRVQAFERRFGLKAINAYGLTEVGGLIAHESLDEAADGTSGRPHPHYEFRIADEQGCPVPPGEIGEILVRPRMPGLMALHYIGRAEGTLASWRDLWVHTSDQGRITEQGHLQFLGRHAHWIRRRSENVSVNEVEQAVSDIEGVRACGVVGLPSELGDEDIMAFVVLAEDAPSLPAINALLLQRLAYFKVPRYYAAVDSLPRTVKGDVSRRDLKERGVAAATWDAGPKNRLPSGTAGST